MLEIGIVEARSIINLIAERYNCDFSDYALTSIKRRIEKFIETKGIKFPDVLMNKLKDDKLYADEFIDYLTVPSTEMFRDPSLWRILRDEFINNIYRDSGGAFKIWLPNSVSGDELFSLSIMLTEIEMLDKVKILVSSISNKSLETIKSGVFLANKLEINTDNYIRANGKKELSHYYLSVNDYYVRDLSLIQNVVFFNQNTFLEPAPQGIKLVIFRNKMIYFNQTLQSRILKTLFNTTLPGGVLIIGAKESLNNLYGNNEFVLVDKLESVYKRRI